MKFIPKKNFYFIFDILKIFNYLDLKIIFLINLFFIFIMFPQKLFFYY